MNKTIAFLSLLSFFVIISACSSAIDCTKDKFFRIDYFSGGGFTGMERGVTIDCNGWLKKWERKLNSPKTLVDSVKISSSVMKNISNAMDDTSIFSYAMNQTANCKVINTHWVYSHRYRAF